MNFSFFQRMTIATLLAQLALTQSALTQPHLALALPPVKQAPEDVPEEILRTQIILDARSPIDGTVMTPAEYAVLQAELREFERPGTVAPEVERVVQLLRLRRFIKRVLPFIPIK